MRNIQDDNLKLSYANLYSLNKNSQPDVIEEGENITVGFEISGNDLKDGVPGKKLLVIDWTGPQL